MGTPIHIFHSSQYTRGSLCPEVECQFFEALLEPLWYRPGSEAPQPDAVEDSLPLRAVNYPLK